MLLRDALIQQNPNLCLQRSAMDEIAKLDAKLLKVFADIDKAIEALYSRDTNKAIKILEEWL